MWESIDIDHHADPQACGSGVDLPTGETADRAVEPIPMRYWWFKRLCVASGCVLVVLVLLWVWWGWEANRRLQAEIDSYIAAGEPIYPEDLDAHRVPMVVTEELALPVAAH